MTMNDIHCNEFSKSDIGFMACYEQGSSSFSYYDDSDFDDSKDNGSVVNDEEVNSSILIDN